jgi:hypothetical protein
LFGESASRIVISCDPNKAATIKQMAVESGLVADLLGQTQGNNLEISVDGKVAVSAPVSDLKQAWAGALHRIACGNAGKPSSGNLAKKLIENWICSSSQTNFEKSAA